MIRRSVTSEGEASRNEIGARSSERVMELDEYIHEWRSFVQPRRAGDMPALEELESRLLGEASSLVGTGLTEEEAFLIAVRRLGEIDVSTADFAREHSIKFWQETPGSRSAHRDAQTEVGRETLIVLGLATAAGLAVKPPELFGYRLAEHDAFYSRNLSFFLFPLLAGYFAWKRGLDVARGILIAATFVAAAVIVNAFPFGERSQTQILAALHLPIALWVVVGIAFVTGAWRSGVGRIEFVRLSGELFIYYVLIALGGGVLTLMTIFMFDAIGIDVERFVESWLPPCAAGGFIVAAWLADTRRKVIGSIAPMLTRVFTPLFSIALLVFLGAMVWTRSGIDVERNVLIGFDLLLVLVVAMHLYAISSRDALVPPGWFDRMQLLLLAGALVVDLAALAAIAGRISDFGFSPNKTAALGLNLILLVNLAWSVRLYFGFLRDKRPFTSVEQWQTTYLSVYVAWAAFVVVVFPPVFGFG